MAPRKTSMSDAEREARRQWLNSPEAITKRRATMQTLEYKAKRAAIAQSSEYQARLSAAAKQAHANGKFRRKTAISEEEREAASQRMKEDNPVKSAEVRTKISNSLKKQREVLAARLDETRKAGRLNILPMSAERRLAQSEKMRLDNPMRQPNIAAKVAESKRTRFQADPITARACWIRKGAGPTKAEQALLDIISPLGLRFVGDGQLWIGPCQSGHWRNPDFIYGDEQEKIAILLEAHYHSRHERNPEEEIADYAGHGWSILTIRPKELKSMSDLGLRVKGWLDGLKSSV